MWPRFLSPPLSLKVPRCSSAVPFLRRGSWSSTEEQRIFFDELPLPVKNVQGWYKIKTDDIFSHGGKFLLNNYYDSSLARALHKLYPELIFHLWLFPSTPKNFWSSRENIEELIQLLGQKMDIRTYSDWYSLMSVHFKDLGARNLLEHHFGESPAKFLQNAYPWYRWEKWKFSRTSKTYWSSRDRRKEFVDLVSTLSKVRTKADLSSLSVNTFRIFGGHALLLKHFADSPSRAVIESYPEFALWPWTFDKISKGMWTNISLVTEYFSWLGKSLGIKKYSDWASINTSRVSRGLLNIYGSFTNLLSKAYPEFPFETLFVRTESSPNDSSSVEIPTPRNSWKNPHLVLLRLEQVALDMQLKRFVDWYSVSLSDLVEKAGGGKTWPKVNGLIPGIMKLFNSSPLLAFQSSYPQYYFFSWRFSVSPKNMWKDEYVLKRFIAFAEQRLLISEEEDWYRISYQHLVNMGAGGFHRYRFDILKQVYPHISWNEKRLRMRGRKRSSQRWLYICIARLFHPHEVLEEYSDSTLLLDSGIPMELDVYIPDLKLAFEYQGEQHYKDTMIFGLSQQYQSRDSQKRARCDKANITLLEIPHWWNNDEISLYSSITNERPELEAKMVKRVKGEPIPMFTEVYQSDNQ